ncbi:zeta toxin family protein [Pontiellaceae bacterium B12227]|nr:zeta toxin family protein [Pontiellaceae bacterium B12227]
MKNEQPICYVIAGPNGAGKTTFALRYLPEMTGCRNFINADLIADGLSPLDPSKVQLEAGKILLREIRSNVEKGEDFAFETTLSGRSYVKLLKELRSKDWKIILFYLWVPNARFSAARVQQRVEAGGHDIPVEAIARRYVRTVSNLLNVFIPLCDEVMCYNNAQTEPVSVFAENMGERTVIDEDRYQLILESGYE